MKLINGRNKVFLKGFVRSFGDQPRKEQFEGAKFVILTDFTTTEWFDFSDAKRQKDGSWKLVIDNKKITAYQEPTKVLRVKNVLISFEGDINKLEDEELSFGEACDFLKRGSKDIVISGTTKDGHGIISGHLITLWRDLSGECHAVTMDGIQYLFKTDQYNS